MNDNLYFLICASGIFVCCCVFGIMQEDITSHKYVVDGKTDRFTFTLSLVFFQCLTNCLFAKSLQMFPHERPQDEVHFYNYAIMAISYFGGKLASNHSLQYVAYPTQVIGKSMKPIPIMVFGVLFAHQRYSLAKFFFIFIITAGVGLFMYTGQSSEREHIISDSSIPHFGEMLVFVSLCLDGVTGAVQDRIRNKYKPSGLSMMFNCNLWATVYLGVCEIWTFSSFAHRHPIIIGKLLSCSLANALGQNFIFMTISYFGSLVCSVVTTTRKFFTLLGSVLLFGHPLVLHQWFGVVFLFTGLGLDAKFGKGKKNPQSVVDLPRHDMTL